MGVRGVMGVGCGRSDRIERSEARARTDLVEHGGGVDVIRQRQVRRGGRPEAEASSPSNTPRPASARSSTGRPPASASSLGLQPRPASASLGQPRPIGRDRSPQRAAHVAHLLVVRDVGAARVGGRAHDPRPEGGQRPPGSGSG
eukprot:scaffold31546_cov66-Phaeocystis_antarctica.AAC.9